MIAAALWFRPDLLQLAEAPETADPSAVAAPEPVPVPIDPPVVTAPPAALAETQQTEATPEPEFANPAVAGIAVRLRVRAGAEPQRTGDVIDALRQMGYQDVETEEVSFRIALSRVGYFHAADRAAAQFLAATAAPVLGESSDMVPIRDYHELSPDIAPGSLDLWIKG